MPAPVSTRPRSDILRFTSHRHLRQRLVLSLLSGKSIRVDQIRSEDVHVGLRDYEVNLLRLVERVTNGSTIEISVTGESMRKVHQLMHQARPSSSTPVSYPEDHLHIHVTSVDPLGTTLSSSYPSHRFAKELSISICLV